MKASPTRAFAIYQPGGFGHNFPIGWTNSRVFTVHILRGVLSVAATWYWRGQTPCWWR